MGPRYCCWENGCAMEVQDRTGGGRAGSLSHRENPLCERVRVAGKPRINSCPVSSRGKRDLRPHWVGRVLTPFQGEGSVCPVPALSAFNEESGPSRFPEDLFPRALGVGAPTCRNSPVVPPDGPPTRLRGVTACLPRGGVSGF